MAVRLSSDCLWDAGLDDSASSEMRFNIVELVRMAVEDMEIPKVDREVADDVENSIVGKIIDAIILEAERSYLSSIESNEDVGLEDLTESLKGHGRVMSTAAEIRGILSSGSYGSSLLV